MFINLFLGRLITNKKKILQIKKLSTKITEKTWSSDIEKRILESWERENIYETENNGVRKQ